MVKKAAFVFMGCIAVGSVVWALAHHDALLANQALDAQIIEDLEAERPFVALRPANVWGRLEVLAPEADEPDRPAPPPRFVLPMLVIEAPVPGPRSRRSPRGARIASLAAPSGPGAPARLEGLQPAGPEQETLLPETLDREIVGAVMGSMRRTVQQCYDTTMVPGQVNLSLTVEGDSGRVSRVQVDETSTTARCIRDLAGRLRFPRFARERLTIEYPYALR